MFAYILVCVILHIQNHAQLYIAPAYICWRKDKQPRFSLMHYPMNKVSSVCAAKEGLFLGLLLRGAEHL